MRTIVVLAAMLAMLGMAPQLEAGDRGFRFRYFSGHAGQDFHRPHHGFEFHHRGFVGEPRHFKPRRFGHGRFVFKFDNGDLVFKFGHVPRFERHHFGHTHAHRGLSGSRGT